MEVYQLSYSQQKWFEQNIKDYNKNVPYKAQKIVVMISLDSNPTFTSYTMVGNSAHAQLMFGEIGFVWNKLDIQESREFSSHSNNLSILPDRIFEFDKEFIKKLYNITSGNPPTYDAQKILKHN